MHREKNRKGGGSRRQREEKNRTLVPMLNDTAININSVILLRVETVGRI